MIRTRSATPLALLTACGWLIVVPAFATEIASVAAPRTSAIASPAHATRTTGAAKHSAAATKPTSAPGAATSAAPDSAGQTETLRGGQEGTVFRTLTVEGEDRIHIEVARPDLHLELDPEKAPGLDWGTARDVLDRTTPDLTAPLLAQSARESAPGLARPWLAHFASGTVARFRPAVKGVERWKLTVANSRGEPVASFEGHGDPPGEIAWDGRSTNGASVVPGMTYSYVFEAHDRAGNKRNFVGEGFRVSAYRTQAADGTTLAFAASEMTAGSNPSADPARAAAPPVVLEAASWLNQSAGPTQPIRVTGIARSTEQGDQLARRVAHWLTPTLLGDPARVQSLVEVQSDAPEGGAVRIQTGR